jgi:hypothetical protein
MRRLKRRDPAKLDWDASLLRRTAASSPPFRAALIRWRCCTFFARLERSTAGK